MDTKKIREAAVNAFIEKITSVYLWEEVRDQLAQQWDDFDFENTEQVQLLETTIQETATAAVERLRQLV